MKPNTFAQSIGLAALLTALAAGCGDPADDKDRDSTPENETDSDTDTENDDSDTGLPEGDPCEAFHAYAEGCEISGTELLFLDGMCTMLDSLFIESFLTNMLDCFSPDSCDDFIAMMASDDTEGTDTDAAADPFSICAEAALTAAEPEPTNDAFKEHFCAYATQCNAEVTEAECNASFTDPEEMLLFNVLDTPYITDADACVYPLPACSEEVQTCLQDVVETVQSTLAILSGK